MSMCYFVLFVPYVFGSISIPSIPPKDTGCSTERQTNVIDESEGARNVTYLDLSNGIVTTLSGDTLVPYQCLEHLNLDNNQLQTLPLAVFDKTRRLEYLTLHNNFLTTLDSHLFTGLIKLRHLNMSRNLITSDQISNGVFNSDLKNLEVLDLSHNQLSKLEKPLFDFLTSLEVLKLEHNQIIVVSAEVFAFQTSLKILNLGYNQITDLNSTVFNHVKRIEELYLQNNKITDMNGLISSSKNLQLLDISSNNLMWFDLSFIPKSLTWMDIHDNQIDELGNYFSIEGYSLNYLDASYNKIERLEKISIPSAIEIVILKHNLINEIDGDAFHDKQNLSKVDLSENKIPRIGPETLTSYLQGQTLKRSRPEFLLAGNPLVCDCELEWLPKMFKTTDTPIVMDLDDITCQVPMTYLPTDDVIKPINSVLPEEFLCPYRSHCLSSCMCCDFYACDCSYECPDGCSCFHSYSWKIDISNCNGTITNIINKFD